MDEVTVYLLGDHYYVSSFLIHQKYNSKTIENDIAIVYTERPSISPSICLPPPYEEFTDKIGIVVGT